MKYITRITSVTISPENEPTYSEQATHVAIEDEAAGEYVTIEQMNGSSEIGKVRIDPEEWQAIACAVSDMIAEIKKHQTNQP